MRLQRVEMVGFKSFMDRTVLDFRDGVTTILGPNGCGKSNVVDAVRWVLGEQSAKQLRGEKMEDVIFKGSSKRKPLSTCEVTLVFDNSEGLLGIDYNDVAITRRVTRDGGSDYFLNKTPCRLKDLKDLLYDTGAGNNAYSIIEQEMVGQVLNPNENKVRAILEEGSGVVRYKAKRKEALRKLDLTERDLLRVEDIIDEIGRQVRSLARQVGKARRHQRLFGELRSLEMIKARHATATLRTELVELEDMVQAMRAEGSGEDAELARHRARIEEMRPQIDGLESQRREQEHELSKVEADLKRLEGEVLVLRERSESGARRLEEIAEETQRTSEREQELRGELESAQIEDEELRASLDQAQESTAQLEAKMREATVRHEKARSALGEAQQLSLGFLQEEAERKKDLASQETRIQSLTESQENLERVLREGEGRREELRVRLSESEQALATITSRRAELEAELIRHREAETQVEQGLQRALEKRAESADELARAEKGHEIAARIAAEYEGYRRGAASLLKDGTTREKLRGALAETLVVEKGYEAAFELLFGEDADALLVDGLQDASDLATFLGREQLGKGSFLVDLGREAEDSQAQNGYPGRPALELVRSRQEENRHLRSWLGRVRVVDNAGQAVEAALANAGAGISFLSQDGLFIRYDGLVRGGAGTERKLSLFGRQEQVEELAQEVETLRVRLEERAEGLRRVEAQRNEVRQALKDSGAQLRELQDRSEEVAGQVAARRSALDHEEESHRQRSEERDAIRNRLSDLFTQLETLRAGLGQHGMDQEASEKRVSDLVAEVERFEIEREQAGAAASDARLGLAQRVGEARELESRLHRLRAMSQDLVARLKRLSEEDDLLTGQLAEWKEGVTQREVTVKELFDSREGRAEELRGLREMVEVQRGELERAQEEMNQISERQRKKAEALGELENRITRDQLTIQNYEERIFEKYNASIEAGYEAIQEDELPKELIREDDSFPMEQVDELLADRRAKMEKLGAVNFAAMEEYDQKKARLEFLEKQRDDLLSSKEHLMQAIDKINRTARTLFRETFEKVRENFQQIFVTLFEGGEATLELIKTDDPLEADIRIHARPKGKKIDSVALLSGGERALTAIALLFAVYLIKPSPFCLLDEVDAPLDDLNVGRFVRLLESFQEKTQFIVITHNKLTMEAADHLYGVTMEESGVSRLVSVTFEELDKDDPLRALEEAAARRKEEPTPAARLGAGNGELKQLEGEA